MEGPTLAQVAKWLQSYSHPVADADQRWPRFLQERGLENKSRDPSQHDTQTLKEFIVSLVSGPDSEANQHLVQRFLKHAQRCTKESARHATSAPPFSKARAAQIRGSSESSPSTSQPDTVSPQPITAWDLVHATRGHADYGKAYNMPSHLPGWARVKRRRIRLPNQRMARSMGKARSAALVRPRLVALDCEMVATADGDSNALVKVSLVDEQGTVLYQTRVMPRHDIVDYRTEITGLQPSHFEGVTTTRSEARRAVKRCLLESWRSHSAPTILVGHGLSNDLRSLRLDYQPCIDTALIFSFQHVQGGCRPGLRDVHRVLLKEDMKARMEGRHDSAEDAFAAMKLVLHEIGRVTRTPPLPPPDTRVSKDDLACLLVHGIPSGVEPQQLLQLFVPLLLQASESEGSTTGQPVLSSLPQIQGTECIRDSRAVLRFRHAGEANAAFSALPGKVTQDSRGLPAKRVSLGDKLHATVRKFGGHNGFLFPQQAQGKNKRKTAPAVTGKRPSKRQAEEPSGAVCVGVQ